MYNPPLPIPLNVRTDCENCAKRKDELQRMAKVNRMLKQQLKRKIRDIKLKTKKTAKVRNSQVAHSSSVLKCYYLKREDNANIQAQLVIEKRQKKKRFKLQKEAGRKLNLVLTNNAELSEVLPELSAEFFKLMSS